MDRVRVNFVERNQTDLTNTITKKPRQIKLKWNPRAELNKKNKQGWLCGTGIFLLLKLDFLGSTLQMSCNTYISTYVEL